MSVTPRSFNKRLAFSHESDSFAFLRLITRPAPCDAEHARARRCRALAMHHDLAFHAADEVPLLPSEVVVVLHIEQHLRAEILRDVPVNARVVRRRVLAHQFHRGPILLSFLRIE